MKLQTLQDAFDEHGNFIIPEYDPYKSNRNGDREILHNFLFDKDGYGNFLSCDILPLIEENKWSPFSDAVAYYYAKRFDENCHGNYSAIFLWR